jgi:hypothetical protein
VDIVEEMGVLARIEAKKTGTDMLEMYRSSGSKGSPPRMPPTNQPVRQFRFSPRSRRSVQSGLDSVGADFRRSGHMDPNPDYDASDEIEFFFNALAWGLRGDYPPPAYPPV